MTYLERDPHIELNRLSEDVRDTVSDLISQMPSESWRIQENPTGGWNGNQVAKALKALPELKDQFLPGNPRGRKLKVIFPNTLVIGLFPSSGYREAIRHGLFSVLVDERYNPQLALKTLGGNFPNIATHEGIGVWSLTGRPRGDVSILLGKSRLQAFSVIDLSSVRHAFSEPDTLATYSLGNNLLFCAKGKDFLESYGQVVRNMGIPINLR